MASGFALSEQQKRDRQSWLRITEFSFLWYPLVACFGLGLFFTWSHIPFDAEVWCGLLAPIISAAFGFWILRHCAYDKHGNKWLGWSMLTNSVGILKDIAEAGWSGEWAWLLVLLLLLDVCVVGVWLGMSFKMLAVNRSIREQKRPV